LVTRSSFLLSSNRTTMTAIGWSRPVLGWSLADGSVNDWARSVVSRLSSVSTFSLSSSRASGFSMRHFSSVLLPSAVLVEYFSTATVSDPRVISTRFALYDLNSKRSLRLKSSADFFSSSSKEASTVNTSGRDPSRAK
jgi:hypothetical protein